MWELPPQAIASGRILLCLKRERKKNGNNYTRGEKSPFAIKKKKKKKFPIDIKGRPVRGGLI